MAKHKFIEDMRPLLAEAFAEGLTGEEIMTAFRAILTELKRTAKRDGRKGENS
jgi:hypothetical protein